MSDRSLWCGGSLRCGSSLWCGGSGSGGGGSHCGGRRQRHVTVAAVRAKGDIVNSNGSVGLVEEPFDDDLEGGINAQPLSPLQPLRTLLAGAVPDGAVRGTSVVGAVLDAQPVDAAAVVVEENAHPAVLVSSGSEWTREQPGRVSGGVGPHKHEVTRGFLGGVVSLGQAGQTLVSAWRN